MYSIQFSLRCNYRCSYCAARPIDGYPKVIRSTVEKNTQKIIDLFNSVEPGLIILSGGEPALWEDFPLIMDKLPQHYWCVLTNLSYMPTWFLHNNVKFIEATFHDDWANPELFDRYLYKLKEENKRPLVKIIIDAGNEYKNVESWKKWNDAGIPTHFVPNYQNSWVNDEEGINLKLVRIHHVLKEVIFIDHPEVICDEFKIDMLNGQFLTCSAFNSQFFAPPPPMIPRKPSVCAMGTKASFLVQADGKLVRCCQNVTDDIGTIFTPNFFSEPRLCETDSCSGPYFSWMGETYADDNDTWQEFIETGVWRKPTIDEFLEYLEKMGWLIDGEEFVTKEGKNLIMKQK